jgi:DNA-binding GntR family transcriptional regulator
MKINAISRVDQVLQAILTEILVGRLAPGERLYEAKLSAELGVSQATVNAALQDLHNQGVVTKVLNRSTNVSKYTLDDLGKLFGVRSVLEPLAVEGLAARWSPEAETRLMVHIEHMRMAARDLDVGRWCRADCDFHREIYVLCGNPFLLRASLAIAAAPFAYLLSDQLKILPDYYAIMTEEHFEIVEAMKQGPETAGRVIREAIRSWQSRMTNQPALASG